ncbi:MAG TPA: hypothetical protein VGD94_12460 [Vicinamibacterales bacterium]
MLSPRIRVFALCLALIPPCTALAAYAEPAAKPIDPIGKRLRGLSPRANEVIKRGTKRSATFRTLVDTISKSDLVVYLETTKALPSGLDGRLMFLTAAGGVRYLHVQVMGDLDLDHLVAVAAHELQHAVEVATHPEVVDAASLAALYQRIGIPGIVKNRYDTLGAQSTGKRVRAELG